MKEIIQFFNHPFFIIVGGVATILMIIGFCYTAFLVIKGVFPVWYRLGNWDGQNHSPQKSLEEFSRKIENDYVNPTNYKIKISLQTHSVTVIFKDDNTEEQKSKIIQAKDCFLKKLENFSEDDFVKNLIKACFYKRVSDSEQFLFDFKIPVLMDDNYSFKIYGEVQERNGGFRKYILDLITML